MSSSPDELSIFVERLTASQSALYGFIYSALANGVDASDVLQETNRALWKKAHAYDAARPFLPWAYRVAHFEILVFRKKQTRDRLVFTEDLLGLLAEEYSRQVPEGSEWGALDACLGKLNHDHRELIESRYAQGDSVAQIAARQGKPPNAVSAMLYRIRALLAECLEKKRMEGEWT
jgi:RNA polymerase sigma-70 factor (ECF subfamily)